MKRGDKQLCALKNWYVSISNAHLQNCPCQNKPLVTKLVLLLVNGIDEALYEAKREVLAGWREVLGEPITLMARHASMVPSK